ncbi:MAG: hypothetical protein LQ352_005020 [Teloschistes flavicans]|nr:MAG: hypothetical protein LQ352_005020 [Teloschistes flavicans]
MAEGHSSIDTVVNIFNELRTVDERSTFCKQFLRSLPRHCQRELVSHLEEVNFEHDPIEKLPLEILCLVFQHLDIYQAFQLRRVSKLWLQTLSAPHFVESLLHPWFAMGEVDLRMPPNISAEAAMAIKAEHVDAYKTGNPFSMVRGEWAVAARRDEMLDNAYIKIVYKHGRLAWIDEDDVTVHVRNLESGQQTLYVLPNREKADLIALSSDLVAVTTLCGRCYAWDCTNGAPSSIKVPSSWNLGLFASGKALAIVHSWEGNDQIHITTWSLYTGSTRSFCIRTHARPRDSSIACWINVHMKTDSLVILERQRGPPDEVFFTHCNLDGKAIAAGTSGPLRRTFRSGYVDLASWPQQESSTMELKELDRVVLHHETEKFEAIRDDVLTGTRGIFRPVYDVRIHRFISPWEPARRCKEFEHDKIGKNGGNYWFCWKDTAFRSCWEPKGCPSSGAQSFWEPKGCSSSGALNLRTGEFRETHMPNLVGGQKSWRAEGWETRLWRDASIEVEPRQLHPILYIGDEIYMIRIYPSGFTAFCFDKHVTMAGEAEDFRQRREDLRVKRIKRRDFGDSTESLRMEHLEKQLAEHEREMLARDVKHGQLIEDWKAALERLVRFEKIMSSSDHRMKLHEIDTITACVDLLVESAAVNGHSLNIALLRRLFGIQKNIDVICNSSLFNWPLPVTTPGTTSPDRRSSRLRTHSQSDSSPPIETTTSLRRNVPASDPYEKDEDEERLLSIHEGLSIMPAPNLNSVPAPKSCRQSAKLHCLYGLPVQHLPRSRSASHHHNLRACQGVSTHPFARSRVYDLRQHTENSLWGPFLSDGSLGVDWEKVEALTIILAHNIQHFGNKYCEPDSILLPPRHEPFAGATPYSLKLPPIDPQIERPLPNLSALGDPYNITGLWMRVVCFLDYRELFTFNFSEDQPLPNLPRPPLDTEEAIRFITMKLETTGIERPGEGDGQRLPVVHFKGFSTIALPSIDPNANSQIRGTVRLTPENQVRWTTFSVFHGEERWRSESIQLGGVQAGRGVVGYWFDKDFDEYGPAGPTSFWKISNDPDYDVTQDLHIG